MQYFITGASGFIGGGSSRKLLAREGSVIYFLVRAAELNSLDALYEFWDFTPADESQGASRGWRPDRARLGDCCGRP
jgi:uncharacterized protein YbjT (DUF2867 family)